MRNRGGDRDAISPTGRRRILRTLGAGGIAGVAGCLGIGDDDSAGDHEINPPDDEPAILVLSATEGQRRDAIDAGNDAIRAMGPSIRDELPASTAASEVNIDVLDDPTGEASAFPASVTRLLGYDAIVWNNTSGSVLDPAQQDAFREYIRNGGGYVGIHAAAETHHEWDWYRALVGAGVAAAPDVQRAAIHVTDRVHPSTAHLPSVWEREDEWYDFTNNPRGDVHVLAAIDEDTYDGAAMEDGRADHPIAWCHRHDGGRAWYTGLGHTTDSFSEDAFLDHLARGIAWAAGWIEGGATGTVWDAYKRTTVTTDTVEPMAIDLTPDGRIVLIERGGRVLVLDPADGDETVALELPVHQGEEDGLLGIALDPRFAETNWLYLYYSPDGSDAINRLSRVTLDGDTIDPESEVIILEIPVHRDPSYHHAGDLQFGPEGMLYLSTGDDTDPFESDGFAPIDERQGRENFDAQRSAADTADLRGSILRIIPHEDGSYSVPEDNLFTEAAGYGDELNAGLVRDEIYAMGFRNPFRIAIDAETGWLYVADYGPDSMEWDPARGPIGIREYLQIRTPGNYNWPYTRGPTHPYVDYDFDGGTAGEPFDPEAPVNDSPNNDGLTELPAAEPATMYVPTDWASYLDGPDDTVWTVPDRMPWPSIVGRAPMSGPVFHRPPDTANTGLPAYFEGKWLIADWDAGWLQWVTFDDAGEVLEIEPFVPDQQFFSPMDMEVGPDGQLYVLDWGAGFQGEDPRLYRIEHDEP